MMTRKNADDDARHPTMLKAPYGNHRPAVRGVGVVQLDGPDPARARDAAGSALRRGLRARLQGPGAGFGAAEERLEQACGLGRVLDRELPGAPAAVRARDRRALDEADLKKLLKLAVDLAALEAAYRRQPRRRDRLAVVLQHEDQREQAELL